MYLHLFFSSLSSRPYVHAFLGLFYHDFQNFAAKAGITYEATLIDHFSFDIDQQIATIILPMSSIPTTLQEWLRK